MWFSDSIPKLPVHIPLDAETKDLTYSQKLDAESERYMTIRDCCYIRKIIRYIHSRPTCSPGCLLCLGIILKSKSRYVS